MFICNCIYDRNHINIKRNVNNILKLNIIWIEYKLIIYKIENILEKNISRITLQNLICNIIEKSKL